MSRHKHRDRDREKSRVISSKIADGVTLHFSADRIVGNGSFGVVYEAKVAETGEVVAIKKVLQDKRFKNRELHIMKQLSHCNVVQLKHCFYTSGSKPDELFLNLVLEYVPETVFNITRHYLKAKQLPPLICVKLYMYQLCRSLAYIHSLDICHRDIKPQNLLVDPSNHTLKLCDFGSAKRLVPGEPNVAYICSRYYRAPELIFGATDYTTAVDIWSAGCVCAELLLGTPLFPGASGVDQLVEIIKVLGTPKREDIRSMNCSYADFKFPQIKSHPWNKVLRRAPAEAIDFVARLLVYTPGLRLTPLEAMAHPVFDELRYPGARLPNGKPLPPLFNFTKEELQQQPELFKTLIPEHARTADNWPPPTPAHTTSASGAAHSRPARTSSHTSAVSLPRAARTGSTRASAAQRTSPDRSKSSNAHTGAGGYGGGASEAGSGAAASGSGASGAGGAGAASGTGLLPRVGSGSHNSVSLPSVPPPSVRQHTGRHTNTSRTAMSSSSERIERVPTIGSRSSRNAGGGSYRYRGDRDRERDRSDRGDRNDRDGGGGVGGSSSGINGSGGASTNDRYMFPGTGSSSSRRY